MMKHRLTFVLVLCASAPVAMGEGPPADWPQWRGPNRDAGLVGAAPWPDDLKELNPTWRVELGPSYSGAIVVGERVFVTETKDERFEVVHALDRRTGVELWKTQWEGAMSVPFFAKSNGDWIRSTPACDGESLFVAGMRDVLVCLDAATGGVRWRVDFIEKYATPVPAFGFVCSPLVAGDHVYVQAGASLCKLNKRTGEVVWRTLETSGEMMDCAYSSPVIAALHGTPQILVQTREQLSGVDPETGKVLWSQDVPALRRMNILTPTVHGDGILTSTLMNGSIFFRVETEHAEWRVHQAWRNKAQGYMSSPVIVKDHAYLHLGNGRLSCISLRTGEEAWRSLPFGKYWSMIANGDKILALDERGELLLIRADASAFALLDRREVSEQEAWAHLAVSGNVVLVRSLDAITAWRWE
jgi:outer membrane protein assembly factor BamB